MFTTAYILIPLWDATLHLLSLLLTIPLSSYFYSTLFEALLLSLSHICSSASWNPSIVCPRLLTRHSTSVSLRLQLTFLSHFHMYTQTTTSIFFLSHIEAQNRFYTFHANWTLPNYLLNIYIIGYITSSWDIKHPLQVIMNIWTSYWIEMFITEMKCSRNLARYLFYWFRLKGETMPIVITQVSKLVTVIQSMFLLNCLERPSNSWDRDQWIFS